VITVLQDGTLNFGEIPKIANGFMAPKISPRLILKPSLVALGERTPQFED
jgi:hypothetical protein